jgi:hypothetical protein
MSCFIDRLNLDKDFINNILSIMPNVKETKYCKDCLENNNHEVEPIDCPYYFELFGNDKINIYLDPLYRKQLDCLI